MCVLRETRYWQHTVQRKKKALLKIFFFKNASETKDKSTTVRVNVDWLKEVKAEVVHRLAEPSTK